MCFLHTSFGLTRGVQVKDHIQCLSKLPGSGFAIQVLTNRSDVHCLGMKTAVEEFLRLQQDSKTSLEEEAELAAVSSSQVKYDLQKLYDVVRYIGFHTKNYTWHYSSPVLFNKTSMKRHIP